MVRVCFVCLGNICRSPTAEGIFRQIVAEAGADAWIDIDSAGTSAYHAGDPPDRRSAAAAAAQGVQLSGRSRQVTPADFDAFDYVVAMDSANLGNLRRIAPTPAHGTKLSLLRDWDPASRGQDVPDPYYGGSDGFNEVFRICDAGCRGLLAHILAERD